MPQGRRVSASPRQVQSWRGSRQSVSLPCVKGGAERMRSGGIVWPSLFSGRNGAYFCVTKSTKSQQRRASRPPLQTSAHLRECAAGSMRAGLGATTGAKNNPAERKSELFLISKSARAFLEQAPLCKGSWHA